MNRTKKASIGFTLIITLLMSVLSTGMAFASEGNEVEVIGTIVGIFPETFSLEIEVDNEGVLEILVVQVGQNFDFDTVVIGDQIEAKGTLNEEGTLVLTELKIQERARDQVKLQDGEGDAYFCTDEEKVHPIAEKIAGTYGVDYETLLGYLCAEPAVPLGQIMLALQTAALTGDDFTIYLDGFENISWGQIWQEYDIQGKPDKGVAPGQIQDKQGEGDPEDVDGNGKNGKDGEGLDFEDLLPDWLPQSWFQKGKK